MVRADLILTLSYKVIVFQSNNYGKTIEEQVAALIIWIDNLSMSTLSCPSPSAMSSEGILTKFMSLPHLEYILSLWEIL